MLLNNFKPILLFNSDNTLKNVAGNDVTIANFLQNAYYGTNLNNHTVNGTIRSFDYTTTTAANSYTSEQTSYNWGNVCHSANSDRKVNATGFVLFVGSGNRAVTSSDYCLESPLTLNVTSSYCATNSDGKVIVQRSFYNNTGSDVVIKEVGCYIFATRDTSTGIPIVMIGRRVLPTPVTLPAGETFTFTYTIDMNSVSFSEDT